MAFLDDKGLSNLWSKILAKLNTKANSSHDHDSISGTAANVTGVVGIANGGTGATTAAEALAALGGMSQRSDGIELGQNLNSSSNSGGYIDFHFNGNTSDYTTRIMEVQKGRLNVSGNFDVHGWLQCSSSFYINAATYGKSLPAAGHAGRVFFKKV